MGRIINVILSGGVGSRLWPLSRKSKPKQYLPIFDGQTLFQKTMDRNKALCDSIMVVGNRDNFELSREDLRTIGIDGYMEIVEASPRNTAAAIAFAAFASRPDDVLFVTPSDHLIQMGESYIRCVKRGLELAREGFIVTFGLRPTRPETGFGYIEYEGEEVMSFREKPNLHSAERFLAQGNMLWNSGMFCFYAGLFLEELKEFEPKIYEAAHRAFIKKDDCFLPGNLSMEIPSISVDFAVMERTKKIKVVPSEFEWSDMGSFESIYEYLESKGHPRDSMGNMVIGSEVHTEFTGLKNTILIYTSDAVLVLKKEKAQEVKKVFERLEAERPELVK